MYHALRGFLLGLIVSVLVYLAETTTGQLSFPSWLLIVSFPVCWAVGGYLWQRWHLDD